jgi:voltage-gated potassium channel
MTKNIKARVYEVIFEADTPAGKAYDVVLLIAIALSVLAVMLDSVKSIRASYAGLLGYTEWFFTLLFTLEYGVRLWCVERPVRYARSFFGIIDFLSIIPTYLGLVFHGSRFLVSIRFLRMLRFFRVLKLSSYEGEVRMFLQAFKSSRRRIAVFLFSVLTLVVVLGTLMYVIENTVDNGETAFTSIPRSIYWAIVTLTTVGYGDIVPVTPFGQAVASLLMILGYSIIVVPTGIVSVELSHSSPRTNTQVCPKCLREGHDDDAIHCKYCGSKL